MSKPFRQRSSLLSALCWGTLIQALEIHRRPRTPPDFWQEHLFDSRNGGEVEILWVNYRNDDPSVTILEKHVLPGTSCRATVRLDHTDCRLVRTGRRARSFNARAFHIEPGRGVCMKAGAWHAARSSVSTYLMLTRRSTTLALVAQLNQLPHPDDTLLHDIEEGSLYIDL